MQKKKFMKKMTQICQISKKNNIQIARFLWKVQKVAKNIQGFWFFFLLSYLVCDQIWLNHLMDDHHFSYITKLERKTPSRPGS